MNFQRLDWDSEFFGFEVAKIIPSRLGSDALGAVLKESRFAGVSLVYWASDSGDAASQEAALKFSGFLADRKTIYTINFSRGSGASPGDQDKIRAHSSGDPVDELEKLALISGQYSRFRMDPGFPGGKFEDLYRLWLSRSLQGLLAEKVLVFHEGSRAAGLVTVGRKDGVGEIGLLAVHPDFGGRGVGTALVEAARSWFIQAGCGSGRVVTQGGNEPAKRLYEKCGYALEKIENFYHFWLGKPL